MDVLVFGASAEGTLGFLQSACSQRENPHVLTAFLNSVAVAIRADIANIPCHRRAGIPPFNDFLEFLVLYRSSPPSAAVDSFLLTTSQLANWIYIISRSPKDIERYKAAIGFDIGLLAAAVISAQPHVFPISFAVAAVRASFRIGLLVDQHSPSICAESHADEHWSYVVHGQTIDEISRNITEFASASGHSKLLHPYVTYMSNSGVVLSGVPQVLQSFFRSADLRDVVPLRGSPRGCLHAPHLYSPENIQDILEDLPCLDAELKPLKSSQSLLLLCSGFKGIEYHVPTRKDLIGKVITDILVNSVDLDLTIQACRSVANDDHCEIRPVVIESPLSSSGFLSLLKNQIGSDVSVLSPLAHPTPGSADGTYDRRQSKIAIVGMSGRFPGGNDVYEFWNMLQQGKDMHKKVPSDRFDVDAHFDPSGKGRNKSHTPYGCFIDNPGYFDPRFFNMSPREAVQTDPMQRLQLLTAYEALEMSGYVANRTPSTMLDRVGTFYGQTSDDWREINEAQDIDTYFITGGVRAFGPGRINYYFKFTGPSYNVDTACSSSMAAIHIACNSLWAGNCDTAIAGGCNVLTNPDIFSGLSKGQFLSKVGPCQTFDQNADGYCRGDGVASVILKRLEDAEADGDNVLGIILSAATNHSANAVSITHPHAETQSILYEKVIRDAGIDPLDICYVEMHGTGTQAGDGCEMESVTNVFAPQDRQRRSDQPLYLSSVKANVGHGEAVSGVTALIKVLLMLRHSTIPPHAGIKGEINHGFPKDLMARNVHIPFRETRLPEKDGKRHIFVNNFSAAGGNSAIMVEEGFVKSVTGRDPRHVHVVSVSARALSSIKTNLQRLSEFIDNNHTVDLPSLAYTTTARRTHHNYRASFLVKNTRELRDALIDATSTDIEPINSSLRIAFTFTGQGSHYAGMAADLFNTSTLFRKTVIHYDFLARSLGYLSILPLVQGSPEVVSELSPLCVQVALVVIQMALVDLWASWGILPDVVIGHSLGEYAALFAAGIISAHDAIFLVGERARLLQKNCTSGSHAMLAVKASVAELSQVTSSCGVEVACVNGPMETVLSGTVANISMAKDLLQYHGKKATLLNIPFAFHSSQVDTILDEYEAVASVVQYGISRIPLLSPLHASTLINDTVNAKYLARHARETVDYDGAIRAAKQNGVIDETVAWIEIGPQPVSLNFVKSSMGTVAPSGPSLLRNEPAWSTLSSTCSMMFKRGATMNWNEFHRDFSHAHQLLELPAYGWSMKNYWIEYKNNWCLTKGDATVKTEPLLPHPCTTTVHEIVQEEYSETDGCLLAQSNIARPDLKATIYGHIINGTPLCPSTIYCDIGYTIGAYMYRKLWGLGMDEDVPGMNIRDMEVPKPLIASSDTSQMLKIEAKLNKAAERMSMRLFTGTTDHAVCSIDFSDVSIWQSEWSRVSYLVQDRVRMLAKRADDGEVDTLRQGTIYKLFGSFIQYDGAYRGLQRVLYDMDNIESAANVTMQPVPENQTFTIAPYWIDSVGHLAGFTVNCNDNLDPENQVYVSHGWESCRFLRTPIAGKKYTSYVRMLPGEAKILLGDVYLFEEGEITAVIGGLKFQCIPRKVLNMLLPHPNGSKTDVAPSCKIRPTEEVISQVPTSTKYGAPATIVVSKKIGVTSHVLDVIAEECGVALSELADANSFTDLGVDSLMQLAISGRLREEVELDVHSSLFLDHPTIGALKAYLGTFEGDVNSSETLSSSEELSMSTSSERSNETPPTRQTPPDGKTITLAVEDVSQALAKIVSHNTETDSLLRESTATVESYPQAIIPPLVPPKRTPSSVLLQGNHKTATNQLFLIADGGGSATSYVDVPRIDNDTCVWGLNSPFIKIPHEFTCSLEELATLYVNEIQRRQPQGPYNIGGWSAGGVAAYEAARQLIGAGHKVERLILLDSPCPLTIGPLPQGLHRWFGSVGLLGEGQTSIDELPPWLLDHFQATITALINYNATPLDPRTAPETYAVWCRDGVCKYPTDPRPEPYPTGHALFLLDNKSDFGPDRWDELVGREKMHCVDMPGNHFSMMKSPQVEILGAEIKKALQS